jgi:hypothetical protein
VQLSGALRIVWPRPAMGMVQKVPQRPESAFPTGRGDVQGFSGGQLHARGHEVKLYPPAFGVLMAHPGDVILLGVETREGQRLQLIHDQALLIFGRRVLQGETDHAMGVAPLPVDAVDQIPRPVHVTTQNLGRGMVAALAVRGGQILRDGPAPATPAAGELNQHRAASHVQRAGRPVPGQSRSASPGARRSPPESGGSRRGPVG